MFLQATTRRVSCPEHGVVVAGVPWARPGSRFTTAFEDTCAWLVCHAALSAPGFRLGSPPCSQLAESSGCCLTSA